MTEKVHVDRGEQEKEDKKVEERKKNDIPFNFLYHLSWRSGRKNC